MSYNAAHSFTEMTQTLIELSGYGSYAQGPRVAPSLFNPTYSTRKLSLVSQTVVSHGNRLRISQPLAYHS